MVIKDTLLFNISIYVNQNYLTFIYIKLELKLCQHLSKLAHFEQPDLRVRLASQRPDIKN